MENKTIFNITKKVRECLLQDDILSAQVKGQIMPIIAPTAQFPFICVMRGGTSEETNKSYTTGYPTSIVINIFSDKYDESLEIAEKVYNVIRNNFSGKGRPVLANFEEDWSNDTFIQSLSFVFEL